MNEIVGEVLLVVCSAALAALIGLFVGALAILFIDAVIDIVKDWRLRKDEKNPHPRGD